MTRPPQFQAIAEDINEKILLSGQTHFLGYHFHNQTRFACDFIDFMCQLESLSPRAGYDFIKRIGGLKGTRRSTYEQIVQAICELVIAKKFVDSYPAEEGYTLQWEPKDTAETNPEFMIVGKDWRILVEVKAPSLNDYDTKNRAAATQLPARSPGMKELMTSISGKEPALPLDNKVKDFLVSAEKKFSSFKESDVPTYGLLVICWGLRMFEAVTPLSSEGCGLLKDTSFYEIDGQKVRFPHVSGVVVTQHQHFVQEILAERYPVSHPSLYYGDYWEYNTPPNPVFSENKHARRQLPREFKELLQTVNAGESVDPIANIVDTIFWLHRT